ncbi:MAG: acetoin utilization protein AcuC [Gammaproteobacteria bacterium]|nr:acetoin utilization protein AcuC [Gammaproteobacteria bacterium]
MIGSALWRTSGFGAGHPLSIPRIGTLMNLCDALDWLTPGEFRTSPPAPREQIERFHTPEYVTALAAADAAGVAGTSLRERHGVGTRENPLFRGVFERAATAVGGSILAAELALSGHLSFHPAGGTHHARADRASGFCYFNDPVFALLRLADAGLERLAYVDLDAHHGDGVQEAFAGDPRVHTFSIHERGRWPHTGASDDRGGGRARNFAVPSALNDSELRAILEYAIEPTLRRIAPQAIVAVCGTDALAGDPLSGLALGNRALWDAVGMLVDCAPVSLVLGGGGYNPWTVARCWAGLWATLSGREIPSELPEAAQRILRALDCDLIDEESMDPAWCSTIEDAPREGPIRAEIEHLIAESRRREFHP